MRGDMRLHAAGRVSSTTLRVLCAVSPFAVLVSIWVPEWNHYRLEVPAIPATLANASAAEPARLQELSAFDLGPIAKLSDEEALALARELANGRFALPHAPVFDVDPRFAPQDLGGESSFLDLNVASLALPDVYLRAARISGDLAWLDRAREYLNRWWRMERDTRFPSGLQWNDHAVAARVFVLTRYWNALANSQRLSEQDASWLLDAINRSVALLLKPENYTPRTNHGFMQSLALLHVAACFPRLPISARARTTGLERVHSQLHWYLSREGVVLEHSADYHQMGVELIGAGLRYLTVLGQPIPDSLAREYTDAVRFYAALKRPDGTLPAVGDANRDAAPIVATRVDSGSAAPLELLKSAADAPDVLAPLSGFAIWRSDGGSHAVVTWSNFATESHKHADDLSIVIWARGHDWITASGYWPYDSALRDPALGWCGSNGPHYAAETSARGSDSSLIGSASLPALRFLHAARVTADAHRIDRQILQIAADTWLIIDAAAPQASTLDTCWTFDPAVRISAGESPNTWRAEDASGTHLFVTVAGSAPVQVLELRQSSSPFGGSISLNGAVVPTTTLKLRSTAGGGRVTLLSLADGASGEPTFAWQSVEDWRVDWRSAGQPAFAQRRGAQVEVSGPSAQGTLQIERADTDGLRREKLAINAAYQAVQAAAPAFPVNYRPYRIRMSWAVAALGVVQLAAMIVVGRTRWGSRHPAFAAAVLLMVVVGWAAVGWWLATAYFA
jgi:heparinase II/III-like protein